MTHTILQNVAEVLQCQFQPKPLREIAISTSFLGGFTIEILESPCKTSGHPVEGTKWRAHVERERGPAVQPVDDSGPSLDLNAPA